MKKKKRKCPQLRAELTHSQERESQRAYSNVLNIEANKKVIHIYLLTIKTKGRTNDLYYKGR